MDETTIKLAMTAPTLPPYDPTHIYVGGIAGGQYALHVAYIDHTMGALVNWDWREARHTQHLLEHYQRLWKPALIMCDEGSLAAYARVTIPNSHIEYCRLTDESRLHLKNRLEKALLEARFFLIPDPHLFLALTDNPGFSDLNLSVQLAWYASEYLKGQNHEAKS